MKREGEAWPKAKGACTFVLGTLLVKLYSGNWAVSHVSQHIGMCPGIFGEKLWNGDRYKAL